MRRTLVLAVIVLTLAVAGQVHAQGQNPTVGKPPALTPTISPYVNLRRGASTGVNYFGIVRPQLEFRRDIGQLESRVSQDEATATVEPGGVSALTTGHASSFFNYSHYFPSLTSSPYAPRRLSTTSTSRPARGVSSHLNR